MENNLSFYATLKEVNDCKSYLTPKTRFLESGFKNYVIQTEWFWLVGWFGGGGGRYEPKYIVILSICLLRMKCLYFRILFFSNKRKSTGFFSVKNKRVLDL